MNIINSRQILQKALSRKLGLSRYAEIMKGNPEDTAFQKLFNSFYGINSAHRSEQWKKAYYELFSKAKKTPQNYSFGVILTSLHKEVGMIEPSFSSKMLATIDDSKPIWDQYVLKNLGLKLVGGGECRLNNAIDLYSRIESEYRNYLDSPNGKESIEIFDLMLPDYKFISNTKKIDFLLWSKRQGL